VFKKNKLVLLGKFPPPEIKRKKTVGYKNLKLKINYSNNGFSGEWQEKKTNT
jgi:hypothetical protein